MSGFDKVHSARLTALADHLENAQELKVGAFYFGTFLMSKDEMDFNEEFASVIFKGCGTAGCACGEAAMLWPKAFPIGCSGVRNYFSCAQKFFGITVDECRHLFAVMSQDTRRFGGRMAGEFSTRYEVAANIREFLEYKAREAAANG